MRTAGQVAVLTTCLLAAAARGAVVEVPHVRVTYEGITEQQAKAIADTLSAARKVYAEGFGFDMPARVHCTVDCGEGKGSRLFTDGEDAVFLSLPSADKLARPAKSGTFTLYGLCHELGHVAMYRVLKDRHWMTGAAMEGWAHYAGSVVVDEVYKAHGDKLWAHDPYDYRADGTARLAKQRKAASPPPIVVAAGAWQSLGELVGPKGYRKIFAAWEANGIDPANDKAAVVGITKGLADAFPDKYDQLTGWWVSVGSTIHQEPAAAAQFRMVGLDRSAMKGQPLKVVLDDGSGEGKKSVAGGGHARHFVAPGGDDWYLTAVSVYGARYGGARPPSTSFTVALCDADMLPIAAWKQPNKLFERGEPKWVRIELPPTRVPAGKSGFYLCFDFRPTASQGVFVFFDDSTKGKEEGSSRVAIPGKTGNVFSDGDWMIRAELDRPKATDALGPVGDKATK